MISTSFDTFSNDFLRYRMNFINIPLIQNLIKCFLASAMKIYWKLSDSQIIIYWFPLSRWLGTFKRNEILSNLFKSRSLNFNFVMGKNDVHWIGVNSTSWFNGFSRFLTPNCSEFAQSVITFILWYFQYAPINVFHLNMQKTRNPLSHLWCSTHVKCCCSLNVFHSENTQRNFTADVTMTTTT